MANAPALTSVICPVDFSEDSYNSVQYALELCRHLHARLTVLHVYESPVHFTTARFAREEDLRIYREAAGQMKKFLDRIGRMPSLAGVEVEAVLKNGVPSARVLELAESSGAGLIVMAPSAMGPVSRVVLGSNASRIVLHARCQVLVVPPQARFTIPKKIIYGCDLSDENMKAVQALLPYVNEFGARLILLYVQTERTNDDTEALSDFVKRLNVESGLERGAEAVHVCDADPAKAITDYLGSCADSWFALYHRYRTWFAGMSRPSLAKELAADPHIPVFVLNDGSLES